MPPKTKQEHAAATAAAEQRRKERMKDLSIKNACLLREFIDDLRSGKGKRKFDLRDLKALIASECWQDMGMRGSHTQHMHVLTGVRIGFAITQSDIDQGRAKGFADILESHLYMLEQIIPPAEQTWKNC